MNLKSRPNQTRVRWILPSALAVIALIVVGGLFLLPKLTEGDNDSLDRDLAFETQVAAHAAAANKVKPRAKGAGYERISDEEYARRAAASPDQAQVNQRFAQRPASEGRGAPGGLDWQEVGPRPVASEYWSANADASGRVCAIIVDPNNPDIAYTAAAQGGVWKTTDGGVNWTPMSDNLSSLASGALAFHPNDSDIIYYGTGEQHYSGDSFYGDGLFRSDDAAVTWTKIAAKADVGSYISRVVVDPNDTDIIYLSSDLGFLRSTDGGTTWTVTLGPGHCNDIALDPVNNGVVYCAFRSSGVWKSTTYGTGMTLLTNGMPTDGFKRINMALAPSNPLVLYAAFTTLGGELYGMYKTVDGGASWSQLTETPEYLGGAGYYDNCIIVDPDDEDICYAGGNFPFGGPGNFGLIKTTNGGGFWYDVNIGVDNSQPHPDHHIFAFGSDGRLWLGNDGGIWTSTDGSQHWINCNSTIATAQIYTNALHPTNSSFMLAGTQDNGTPLYEGADAWPQVTAGDGGPSAIEWDSPNIYYTTYVQLQDMNKFDAGVYQGNVVGPWAGERASWCNAPLVVDQNQPNTLLAGTHRVWRTTTSGDSWTALSDDLTNGGHLRSIAVADGAPNTIYAGSSDGLVYVTTDAANWDLRSTGLPAVPISDIFIDPEDSQVAYLCTDQSVDEIVFVTEDAGVTWWGITGDLPVGVRAMSLAVDFRTMPPRLYLGTDYGVYASFDDGQTWIKADENLPNLAIYDISVDYANSLLVAGTHGRGMWRAYLDVTDPTVVLTSPVGGETWIIGTDYDITWTATDDTEVESVTLSLSRDGGLSYPEIIANEIANTGSYTWTVTEPVSPNCRIEVLAQDGSMNYTFVESPEDFDISDPVAVDQEVPLVTALRTAHPNPFNPRTTIAFNLAEDTHARLQVFSIDGRLIKTLVDQVLQTGTHRTVWNGTDDQGRAVVSGNYLYSLTTADGFQESGKMVLMK